MTHNAEYVAARCRLYGGRQICPDADDSCRTECVPAAEYEEATGGRVWCSLPVGHGGAHAAHNDGVDDAQ